MTTSTDIQTVKEVSLEIKKIIDELVVVVTEHESSTKGLFEQPNSKGSDEIRETLETMKANRKENKLTKRVVSVLKKQQTLLGRNWKANGSKEYDEITGLRVLVSNQTNSMREIRARLRSVEINIRSLEKKLHN